MFKKKNKGFTLVEILAVIIILATLALIIIPFIGNLIREAKINAAVVSAYGYVEATNNEVVTKSTRGEFVDEKQYVITDFNIDDPQLVVKYEGRGPLTGWFNIAKSKVTDGEFCINGYDIKYEDGKATYVQDGTVCPSDEPYIEPEEPPIFVRQLCIPDDPENPLEFDPEKEYQISKVEDLVCLSNLSQTNTFAGGYFKMVNDIDFNNVDDYVDATDKESYGDFDRNGTTATIKDEVTKNRGFYPIGNTDYRFAGEIDGDGHKISRLYFNRENFNTVGFISFLGSDGKIGGITFDRPNGKGQNTSALVVAYNEGYIHDISILNGTLTSKGSGGGGISYYSTGSIENIYINGLTFRGCRQTCGGVVGYMKTNDPVVVRSYIKNVTIYGLELVAETYYGSYTGGVAGYTHEIDITAATVVNGGVYATYGNEIGGIVGYAHNSSVLEVVFTGTVKGKGRTGGIIGLDANDNTESVASYYVNATVNSSNAYCGGVIGFTDYMNRTNVYGITDGGTFYGKSSSSPVTPNGSNSSHVLYVNSSYNYTGTQASTIWTSFDSSYAKNLTYFSSILYNTSFPVLETKDTGDTNNSGFWFDYDDDGNIVVVKAEKAPFVPNYRKLKNICLAAEIFNPSYLYSIEDIEDLVCLSDKVNSGITFEDTNIYIINDIDFNNNDSYSRGTNTKYIDYNGNGTIEGIKTELTTGQGFPIIGSESKPFKGNLIGQGCTFSNLLINRGSSDNVGLFGYVASEGTVGGIYFNNARITGNDIVGGVVAKLDGTVTSIKMNNSTISGVNYIGGIAGIGSGNVKESEIRSTITASGSYAGGIFGGLETTKANATANIDGVLVGATISAATDNAGGIAGTGYADVINAVIDGSTITNDSKHASRAIYGGGFKTSANIYVNSSSTTVRGNNQNVSENYSTYNSVITYISNLPQTIILYDDILDTWIGADYDDSGHYFDYESDSSNTIVLKYADEDTFESNLKGMGSSSSPYQLKTEADFKMAAALIKKSVVFKLMNNVDVSSFKHFYGLGTYNNYFNGSFNGNNKTISNANFTGSRYAGLFGYLNGGTVYDLNVSNSTVTQSVTSYKDPIVGVLVGEGTNANVSNVTFTNNTAVGTSKSKGTGILAGEIAGTISDININNTNTVQGYINTGMFIGHLKPSATVTGTNLDISGKEVKGYNYVGGSVGVVESSVGYSNLNVNNASVYATHEYSGGLYGRVASGIVSGAQFDNITVRGDKYVGGVAGIVEEGATLQSVSVKNVTITGMKESDSYFIIDNPSPDGYMSATFAGGAVGVNHGTIDEIYVSATIRASAVAGGLVGENSGANANAKGSLVRVNIPDAYGSVGGFIGYNDADALFSGIVEGGTISTTQGGKAVGTYDYFADKYKESDDGDYYTYDLPRNSIVYVSDEFNFSRTTSSNASHYSSKTNEWDGYYYDLSNHVIGLYDDVLDTVYAGDNNSSGYYFDFESNSNNNVVLKSRAVDPITTSFSGGSGTSSNPYIIANEADFRYAAIKVKGSYYFKLNNDVDVSTFKHFYPIGTTVNYFNGKFNGNNKTISNAIIEGGQYSGIFGNTLNANIYDLTITGTTLVARKPDFTSVVNSYDSEGTGSGILLGFGNKTTISNITINNSTVNSPLAKYVGGAIGILIGDSSTIPVTSKIFVNNVTVNSGGKAGGIVGSMDHATLKTASVLNSNIYGDDDTGGIAGTNWGRIYEVYVDSNIKSRSVASGVVGYNTFEMNSIDGIIDGFVVKANIEANRVSGVTGWCWSWRNFGNEKVRGVVEKGTTLKGVDISNVSGNSNCYVDGRYSNQTTDSLVYVSDEITKVYVDGYTSLDLPFEGVVYDEDRHVIGMFDDVIDTIYGGDNNSSDYIFDYETPQSDVIILKNANDLTTTISGSGTENDPYLLAGENDFRDAALLSKGNYYFKIANNLDISTFNHFYQLGTYNNYFNGIVDGNSKTVTNMNMHGGRYAGFIGYLYGGNLSNLSITNSSIIGLGGVYGWNGKEGIFAGSYSGFDGSVAENISVNNVSITSSSKYLDLGVVFGSVGTTTFNNVSLGNDFTITSAAGAGALAASLGNATFNNINLDLHNKTITGSNSVGGIAGIIQNSYNKLSFNSLNVSGLTIYAPVPAVGKTSYYVGGAFGKIVNSSIKDLTLAGITVNASGSNHVGGFAGAFKGQSGYYSTIENITLNNITVNGGSYNGLFIADLGEAATDSSFLVKWININNSSLNSSNSSYGYSGGFAYQNYGQVIAVNMNNFNINSGGYVNGFIYDNRGSINEVSLKGDITSNNSTAVGFVRNNYGTIKGIFMDVNITGDDIYGVIYSPGSDENKIIEGVFENGTLTSNLESDYTVAKVTSGSYYGHMYVSDAVTKPESAGEDGISYSSTLNKNLANYGNLTFTVIENEEEVTYPVLESAYTGDTNESGFWFKLVDNNIKVVKVTGDDTCQNPPCPTPSQQTSVTTTSGTCPDGVVDNEPPTCIFYYSVPVYNGIRAKFSCTDNSGAPVMASMFNSTTDTAYSYQRIIDAGGSEKTGTVDGNTRTWEGSWTVENQPQNPPTRGLCYFYQFAAIDQCGNTQSYVTNSCYKGFSNSN